MGFNVIFVVQCIVIFQNPNVLWLFAGCCMVDLVLLSLKVLLTCGFVFRYILHEYYYLGAFG